MKVFTESFPAEAHASFTGAPVLSYVGVSQEHPFGANANWSMWTKGQVGVTTPRNQSAIPKPFNVVGWTVQFQAYMFSGYVDNSLLWHKAAPYGRLPKIYAGVLLNSFDVTPGTTFSKLPTELASIMKIYDGETDPPFPQMNPSDGSYPAASPVIETMLLPSPIPIGTDDTLQFGWWVLPTLSAALGITVADVSYSILYDNPATAGV